MESESVAGKKTGRRSKPPQSDRASRGARPDDPKAPTSPRARVARRAGLSSTPSPSQKRLRPAPLRRRGERRGRWARALPLVAVGMVALGVLGGLAVVPARTWWSQRAEMAEAREQLQTMQAEVAELQAELELLRTPLEIERRAKQDYGMVLPNEESYVIVDP